MKRADATPDDTSFLQTMYNDVLDRSIDSAGQAAWLSALGSGALSRTDAVLGILGSAEYDGRVVQALYQRYLGHSMDPGGMGHVAALQQGVIRERVMAGIFGSAEYFANRGGGTDVGFLQALYKDVLNRDIDATGQAQFQALLASGFSRADLAVMVLQSREARELALGNLYHQLLHRTIDAGGSEAWIAFLASGGTIDDVIAGILASDEYYYLDHTGQPVGDVLLNPFGPIPQGGVTVTSSSSAPLYTPPLPDNIQTTDWSTQGGTYGSGSYGQSQTASVRQPQSISLIACGLAMLGTWALLRFRKRVQVLATSRSS